MKETMMFYVGLLAMGSLLVMSAAYPLYVATCEVVSVVEMVMGV